jgi:hypothetical protein
MAEQAIKYAQNAQNTSQAPRHSDGSLSHISEPELSWE